MSHLIPQDTSEYLRSVQITSDTAKRVLRLFIKNERTSDPTEAEIYTVLQILLSSSLSLGKISEVLASLRFPEEFIADFTNAYPSLPKIRSGVLLPSLVDINWKVVHELSTSSIRKLHAGAISIESLLQEQNGEFSTLNFTCTKAQLAELVYKLKTALQQVEKTFKN